MTSVRKGESSDCSLNVNYYSPGIFANFEYLSKALIYHSCMKLTFYGAAREVTGSKILLEDRARQEHFY
jgi:hypothetical protein